MGETYSQWVRRQSLARIIREFAAVPEERRTNSFACRIVDLWDARRARGAAPLFVPTIGAAVRAGRPYLSYMCPACTMVGEVEVRSFDRHPGASIESLIPDLSCPRCPKGPFVKLLGLAGRAQISGTVRGSRR